MNNDYSSDDDTIYPATGKYDKKPKKKRLSDELIDNNDDFMDDIIAHKRKKLVEI